RRRREHVESHLRLRRPDQRLLPPPPASFQEEAQPPGKSRPRRGGDRAVAAGADGDEPVRVRDLRQGVPAGPEPAAAPARPQPPLEAQAAEPQRGGAQEGVRVPGARVRPPRPLPRARRPHRHQEALQPQARREEVEVRQVRQALRRAVRLEGPLQGLRHPRVPMRLRHALLKAGQLHHAQGLLRRAGGGECEGRGCGRGGAAAFSSSVAITNVTNNAPAAATSSSAATSTAVGVGFGHAFESPAQFGVDQRPSANRNAGNAGASGGGIGNAGGANDGLTRDFLGLRAFSHGDILS
uniref:Uncharacterized protein n=1 Tax=Aegilops tauschii subsp. strangulata TaxID=200361 RepID=A0A453E5P6_AEGTS